MALHRARSYFLQDPCCAAVFVCAVAVAPLFARSTDVLKKRLHKRANSSYCFARTSVGVGGLGIRDTIQVFDAAREAVAALHSGPDRL